MLAQTKIAPVKSAILIIYDWFNYLIICYLLADAEVGEDWVEDVVGGDLTGDLTEVVDAFAEVLWYEVAWEVHGEAILHAADGVEGVSEGFVVAGVGDDDIALWDIG